MIRLLLQRGTLATSMAIAWYCFFVGTRANAVAHGMEVIAIRQFETFGSIVHRSTQKQPLKTYTF